jgi:aldehyde:ferredoxin oxidoreductase
MHVKGLELPGYDPRRLPTMALGLAGGARGACQNRSSGYDVDLAGGRQPATLGERAAAAAAAEDQAAVLDSLTICKFLRRCFDDLYGEAGELHEMVTGRAVDLRQVGSRIVSLKKLFNQRQGWRRDDDGLPARALAGDLSPERLDGLIDAYYRVRGWDAEGRAPEDTLVG